MRLARHTTLALVTLASLALVGAAARTTSARTLALAELPRGAERLEVARIRSHFDSVLTELAASPAPDIASAGRRSTLIATLGAYRDRGIFPHNYDFPSRAVPYFVDRKTGTLCAVAHLLESTGRRDIVDRVARADNNVWVAELANDSAFTGWLHANGISLAEAARIQVPYVEPSSPAQVARNDVFFVVAPVALATTLASSLYNATGNADGHQRATRVLGLASGITTAGIGTLLMSKADMPGKIGAASAVMGGLSIALAFRATAQHDALVAKQKDAESSRGNVQASLSPVVGGKGSWSGVALSIRY